MHISFVKAAAASTMLGLAMIAQAQSDLMIVNPVPDMDVQAQRNNEMAQVPAYSFRHHPLWEKDIGVPTRDKPITPTRACAQRRITVRSFVDTKVPEESTLKSGKLLRQSHKV